MGAGRLPIHKRVKNPPRMVLTDRDKAIIITVYYYRVLRRGQIQRLYFGSSSATNRVLSRLYQHGFLARRIPPIEYGQGGSQVLYLLDEKGADLVASELGIAREEVGWQAQHNRVSWMFLEHTLRINDFRIAVTLSAAQAGYQLKLWLDEASLKSTKDYVYLATPPYNVRRGKKVAVVPDAYFSLDLGERSAAFFLEADRATVANKRWKIRVKAYLEYVRTGKYKKRYQTEALRVLTVTTTDKRLKNLKKTTQQALKEAYLPGFSTLFWFTTYAQVNQEVAELFSRPIWQVAGESGLKALIS